MSAPSIVTLPVVDPTAHLPQGQIDEETRLNAFYGQNGNISHINPPIPPPSSTQTSYPSGILGNPYQNNAATSNLFASSSTPDRLNFSSNLPPQQPSFDQLLQTSPLIHLLKKNFRNIRPWSEFANIYCFQTPSSDNIGPRMLKNLRYFLYNYAILYSIMLILCICLMPLLIILVVAFLTLQFILIYQGDKIYIGNSFSFSKYVARWAIFIVFFIIFTITVRPIVFFLITIVCLFIATHSALHNGQKFEKLDNEDNFDDV